MRGFFLIALLSSRPGVAQVPVGLTASEIARIGCVSCAGAAEFGTLHSVQLLPNGNILVLDHTAPHLRTFTVQGGNLQSWARSGRGPGELLLPVGALMYGDGSLDVVDMRHQHIARYSPAGKPGSTRRLTSFPLLMDGHSRGDRLYLVTTDFRTPGFAIESWSASDSIGRVVVKLDTVFPRALDGRPASLFPFAAAADGRLALADGGLYHVRVFDHTGRTSADIRRDLPRLEKTDQDVEEEKRDFERQRNRIARMRAAEGGGPPARSFTPYPYRAQITGLDFDGNGNLWIQTGRGTRGQTIFDVYGSAGTLRAQLTLPLPVRTFDVEGNTLVATGIDPDGIPQVTTWRIAGGWLD